MKVVTHLEKLFDSKEVNKPNDNYVNNYLRST